MIFTAAEVARRRERGLKLNYPEGARGVAELMTFGTTILSHEDVMEGVPEKVDEVAIEATFPMARSSSPSTTLSFGRRDTLLSSCFPISAGTESR